MTGSSFHSPVSLVGKYFITWLPQTDGMRLAVRGVIKGQVLALEAPFFLCEVWPAETHTLELAGQINAEMVLTLEHLIGCKLYNEREPWYADWRLLSKQINEAQQRRQDAATASQRANKRRVKRSPVVAGPAAGDASTPETEHQAFINMLRRLNPDAQIVEIDGPADSDETDTDK